MERSFKEAELLLSKDMYLKDLIDVCPEYSNIATGYRDLVEKALQDKLVFEGEAYCVAHTLMLYTDTLLYFFDGVFDVDDAPCLLEIYTWLKEDLVAAVQSGDYNKLIELVRTTDAFNAAVGFDIECGDDCNVERLLHYYSHKKLTSYGVELRGKF